MSDRLPTFSSPYIANTDGDGGGARSMAAAPLYAFDIDSTVGVEYAPVIDDVVRMVCIQLTIQAMLYFSGASPGVLTEELLVLVVYITLGVLTYWLVYKTIVSFK